MAIVTGFTAERMLEIEQSIIVTAHIDEEGHLIVTNRAGESFDAGYALVAVQEASPSRLGVVRLATKQEVIDGESVTRAVTPRNLSDKTATRAEALAGRVNNKYLTPWNIAAFPGYKYLKTDVFTSSGSFVKANYPELKAVRVRLVGGGGGGGGSVTPGSNLNSLGTGGGGGGYAESFILAEDLPNTTTITVGAGGSGARGSATSGSGGASAFGSLVSASGGGYGLTKPSSTYTSYLPGGSGGEGTAGDIRISGSGGGSGTGGSSLASSGHGGDSHLGGGAATSGTGAGNSISNGKNGGVYGGGGSGSSSNASSSNGKGGNGAPGIVIVEVYV